MPFVFNSRKISTEWWGSRRLFWLVFTNVLDSVNCVDNQKVHSLTNGTLEDTEVVFVPDEAVEITIDLEICNSFSAINYLEKKTDLNAQHKKTADSARRHVNIRAVKCLIPK